MKVYSINEWSKLRTVIIGSNFDNIEFNVDYSFKLFFKDSWGWIPSIHGKQEKITIKKQYIEELQDDLQLFKEVLVKNNVQVLVPKVLSKIHKTKSLSWETIALPALNIRDQTLIIENNIIETSPLVSSRYFENDLLKDMFLEAFLDGSKWFVMPRPILNEKTLDSEYITEKRKFNQLFIKSNETAYKSSFVSYDFTKISRFFDIAIDAAQFIRFGKDIIVNVTNRNHYLGYLWIKRMFPQYTFHMVTTLVNNHLDSYIMPLSEGVLLLRNKDFLKIIPDFLKDWKVIFCPQPKKNQFPVYDKNDLVLTSLYIDMNVLSIDGNKVIVNLLFPELIDLLEKEGFEPVPVRHRHRRIFGGGFHCFTLDLLREDV